MTPEEDNSKKENTETPEFELEWLDDFETEEEATPEPEPEEVAETEEPEPEPEEVAEPEPEPEEAEEPAVAEPVEATEAEAPAATEALATPEVSAEEAEEAARRRREKRKAAAKRRRLEEERRKKRRVSTILMVICVIVAIGSAALVIRAVYYYQNANSTYTDARDNNVATVQQTTQAPIEEDPVVETPEEPEEDARPEGAVLEIDFASLKDINPEIVGWLHVPALDLSYPVMQAADNEYYLTHTLENEYNPLGSIFMECTNLPDFSHGNTLIYGHNTVDGTMFGRLREFGDNPTLRASEPYFYVYQADGKIGKYKIYSYYSVYKDSDSFSWFTDDESYDYYVNMTRNLSIENIEADFSKRKNIVTLSTCFGASGTPYRFLVHGVRE